MDEKFDENLNANSKADKTELGQLIGGINSLVVNYLENRFSEFNKTVKEIFQKLDDLKDVDGKVDNIDGKIGENLDGKISSISGAINEKFDGVHKNIDRIFTKTDEFHRKIGENLDGKISSIPDAIEGKFNAVHKNIDGKFEQTDKTVGEIHRKIGENLDGKISSISGAIEGKFEGKFNAVNENISALSTGVKEILKIYNEKVISLEESAKELPVLRSQLETSTKTLQAKEEKISQLDSDLKVVQEKNSSLEKKLSEKETELETAQKNLQAAREDYATAKNSLQIWEESAEIYKPVRTALNNCETFQKFVEERGLNDNSDAGLFLFVQELGKTITFINDVHQVALDVKKSQGNDPQLMTAEETAVYDALNKAYRKIWSIDFDVFTMPGSRKNIAERFEKTAFNKDEAIVLKDPRNKSLKYTQGIFVPTLLNRESRIYKLAYVEAGNL